jgi:hypothetical protein
MAAEPFPSSFSRIPSRNPPLTAILKTALALICLVTFSACRKVQSTAAPAIEFIHVPEADAGNPDRLVSIEGRVIGAAPACRLVLFAMSGGVWWVQPVVERPFTAIQPDSNWKSLTHPGSVYAALLVDSRYRPPLTMNVLPEKGGRILAVAKVKGTPPAIPSVIQFSGYLWESRRSPVEASGASDVYEPGNAWTDKRGFLHLRISRRPKQWSVAEIKLSRSLGYGSYRFVVDDVSHLEPAAVLAMRASDDQGSADEMYIQISRWGQPEDKNAQFVIQPWDVPANSVQFAAPPGTLTYSIKWEPGRVSFQAVRGSSHGATPVAAHVFTSGVPVAGSERLRIAFYVYDHSPHPLVHEAEVVLESFEYLP